MILDGNGEATVSLPEWFEALNAGLRYQLTPAWAAMPDLHVSSKLSNGQFGMASGVGGAEVSWQAHRGPR